MRISGYLIDENLPPSLVPVMQAMQLKCAHVNQINSRKPVKDSSLRILSLYRGWVIITRDDDFVKSHVARAVPEKLVYIFGKFRKKELTDLFTTYAPFIPPALEHADLLEINRYGLKAPLEQPFYR